MSDFFAELEEDIREERIFLLWRKYGNTIIGIAIAIVIGSIGYTVWKYVKAQSQLKAYTTFSQGLTLMNEGKKEEALKVFQDVAQQGGGYGILAQLYEAALLPNPQDLYTKIYQKNQADPALSNLARILSALRTPMEPAVVASLESLSAPNNPWRALALELLALGDVKRGDDMKAAEKYLHLFKQPSLTLEERTRAGMMLSQIDIPPSLFEKLLEGEEQK